MDMTVGDKIRGALRATFPHTKFSVTMKRKRVNEWSGRGFVEYAVGWTPQARHSGPFPSAADIEKLVRPLCGTHVKYSLKPKPIPSQDSGADLSWFFDEE
jgi:hypothetical protein